MLLWSVLLIMITLVFPAWILGRRRNLQRIEAGLRYAYVCSEKLFLNGGMVYDEDHIRELVSFVDKDRNVTATLSRAKPRFKALVPRKPIPILFEFPSKRFSLRPDTERFKLADEIISMGKEYPNRRPAKEAR